MRTMVIHSKFANESIQKMLPARAYCLTSATFSAQPHGDLNWKLDESGKGSKVVEGTKNSPSPIVSTKREN